MYSLEWHTLGMLHKNMHYEIVNCTRILSGLRIQALLHTLKVVHTVHAGDGNRLVLTLFSHNAQTLAFPLSNSVRA